MMCVSTLISKRAFTSGGGKMASRSVESITKIEVGTPSVTTQGWSLVFDVHFHNILSISEESPICWAIVQFAVE